MRPLVHHTQDPVCPLCQEKLKEAHPLLVSWFNSFVKPKYSECHISWSFRDQMSQEQAVKEGKSKLHWPHSPHNAVDEQGNPCSRALDLFFLTKGQTVFSKEIYQSISEASALAGYSLVWGGLYHSLGDFDHFQLSSLGRSVP